MAEWRIEKAIVQVTVDTNAYTANDVMGGLITIPLSTAYSGGGWIHRIQLVDHDNEKAAVHLYFFDNKPTAIADDASFVGGLTEAEADYQIGSVALPAANYNSFNTNEYAIGRVSGKDTTDQEYIEWEYAPSGAIYCYIVCDATPTYTATTDLKLIVTMYLS
jgi:hypothetical protein